MDTTPEVTRAHPYRVPLVVLVVGIVVAIPGMIALVTAFVPLVFGTTYGVPGAGPIHLERGTYTIYERTGSRRSYGPFATEDDDGISIRPRGVVVTSPAGRRLVVQEADHGVTITRSSDRYRAAVEFTTPAAGTYDLEVRQAARGRIMVVASIADVLRRRAGWITAVVVGGIAALVGAVWLCVQLLAGSRRAGRARKAALAQAWSAPTAGATVPASAQPWPAATATPPPAAPLPPPVPLPPAAWHPDPYGRHRLRWWDGARWSEHTSD